MKAHIIFASLLLASVAFAGGDDREVKVKSVTFDGNTAQIELTFVSEPPSFLEKCEDLVVEVRYTNQEDLPYVGSATPTKLSLRVAVDYLKDAQKSGKIVRFGWIGFGLKVLTTQSPCRAQSMGLKLLTLHDGSKAVYSYCKQS